MRRDNNKALYEKIMCNIAKEVKKVVEEGQDIAKNANGIVSNIKGMTSLGGAIQALVDKYINSKLKEDKGKEKKDGKEE